MKTSKFFIVLILVSVSNMAFAAAGRVTLIIEPPLRDGGERLLIYHVECQEVGIERWREVGAPLVPMVDKGNGRFEYVNTLCRVDNLEEGKSYIFRVRVENYYGVGQPGPEKKIEITQEDQDGIRIKSGPGLERVRGMKTSSLATTPSVQEARGMTFLWRKEE
ncbi:MULTISPECIES: fibronectin type III domain-containing protein [Porphyromonadaceae]|uniref:Fibronectin type-III domain-containing protein n=2 Tax=Sanguibacteroides justesenii TaxID=1547597 RepID=A0AB34R3L0_9PORP|nr:MULTISPECIES: fibronectin type III domain-containing protein [Porphyromonadaceae]KIO46188.1 hypothetical protein IE90_05160 [Sanguibacteroides justesenii]PXZ44251.1 fibronectin type III domain-containing protein [Sanguibacteroides justesenii]